MSATWEMDAVVIDGQVVGIVVDLSTGRHVARIIPAIGDIRELMTVALCVLGGKPDAVLVDSRPGWRGAISAVLTDLGVTVRMANPRDAVRKGIAERIARRLRDGGAA